MLFCFTEIEYWLQDMETKLTTEELGHDITSVDSLLKRQQLQEGDIKAHEVRTVFSDRVLHRFYYTLLLLLLLCTLIWLLILVYCY